MKKKLVRIFSMTLVGLMGVSCSTSYDSYGNRRQSVSPGGAVVGAVALGALAYSIGKDDGKRKERRGYHRSKNQFNHQRYEEFNRRGYRSHDYDYRRGGSESRYYR